MRSGNADLDELHAQAQFSRGGAWRAEALYEQRHSGERAHTPN